MKGSMTVEAAYVFPFCFFLLLLVFELGIFLYDQSVLKLTAGECILKVMEEEKTESQIKEELQRLILENGAERTLGTEELQVELRSTATKILVTCKGEFSALGVEVETTLEYEKCSPEEMLRLAKSMRDKL